jgi:hypothetical protein
MIPPLLFSDFTGNAWFHVAHQVIERVFFYARSADVGASAANGLLRFGIGAPQRAGRADVEAPAALAANLRSFIKGGTDAAFLASSPEANCLCHHLFFTHAYASAAQDALFILLPESLLSHIESGR